MTISVEERREWLGEGVFAGKRPKTVLSQNGDVIWIIIIVVSKQSKQKRSVCSPYSR